MEFTHPSQVKKFLAEHGYGPEQIKRVEGTTQRGRKRYYVYVATPPGVSVTRVIDGTGFHLQGSSDGGVTANKIRAIEKVLEGTNGIVC